MIKKIKMKKITVRFPERLKREMQSSLILSGYGLHGKSKWLKEAINQFIHQSDFVDYVENGMNINQAELTDVEAFYLDAKTLQTLRSAFIQIRLKYPLFEGIQSAFIRAAVIHRIMFKQSK